MRLLEISAISLHYTGCVLAMRTFSFYKFCDLTKYEPHLYGGLRSSLLSRLGANGTLGRIYLCQSEGINGLCSVRDPLEFQDSMSACAPELSDLRLNEALEEGSAFLERKLHIRWRKTLVNCGWHNEPKLEKIVSQTSERLGPEQWNSELERDDVVLIDARNSYECEVGKMDSVKAKEVGQGAVRFRDQVDQILEEIGGEVPNKRVLMFCTSGIRCEKLAAILESRGFNNVAHLDGGVTNYVRQARLKGIPVKVVKEVVGNWLSICFQFKFGFAFVLLSVLFCHFSSSSSKRSVVQL
jgi:UPF0176 protein